MGRLYVPHTATVNWSPFLTTLRRGTTAVASERQWAGSLGADCAAERLVLTTGRVEHGGESGGRGREDDEHDRQRLQKFSSKFSKFCSPNRVALETAPSLFLIPRDGRSTARTRWIPPSPPRSVLPPRTPSPSLANPSSPPGMGHRFTAKLLGPALPSCSLPYSVLTAGVTGAGMWFFLFYRARQDGAVLLVCFPFYPRHTHSGADGVTWAGMEAPLGWASLGCQ
jgi:hypothetical protein